MHQIKSRPFFYTLILFLCLPALTFSQNFFNQPIKPPPGSNPKASITPPMSSQDFNNAVTTKTKQTQDNLNNLLKSQLSPTPPQYKGGTPVGKMGTSTPTQTTPMNTAPAPSYNSYATPNPTPAVIAPPPSTMAPAGTAQPQSGGNYSGFIGNQPNKTAAPQGGGWNVNY